MFQSPELNRLIYDLGKAPALVKQTAPEAVRKVIEAVEDTSKSLVPVRTGTLRDSISSQVTEGDGMVIGEAGPTARHGRFVEWGTYKDAPQAFMGPALDRHSHELDELLGSVGENAISRFGMTFT